MEPLDNAHIRQRLNSLDGWTLTGDMIQKVFAFDTFPAAIAFVNHVASLAEAADHHPDFQISYTKVTLSLSTHSAGGLTSLDFDLAQKIG